MAPVYEELALIGDGGGECEAAQEEKEKRRERRGGQAVARDLEMIICFLSGGGERASGAGAGDGELAR